MSDVDLLESCSDFLLLCRVHVPWGHVGVRAPASAPSCDLVLRAQGLEADDALSMVLELREVRKVCFEGFVPSVEEI